MTPGHENPSGSRFPDAIRLIDGWSYSAPARRSAKVTAPQETLSMIQPRIAVSIEISYPM